MTQSLLVSQILFPFPPQLNILSGYLLKNGNELRVVGGAVRDFLTNKAITDFDLACQYLPSQTSALLSQHHIKIIDSGIKYGTITAIVDGVQFQITTLRKDIKNFGRDCEVEFVDDFYADAQRRDFTINALSVDFAGQIYDYFGGVDDLKNKIVKFIGDANERISEDYLRILRFFRFSCNYAKDVDLSGLHACIKYKSHLNDLSFERIRDEFFKILRCESRENLLSILQIMQDVGILDLIFHCSNTKRIDALKNLFYLEKILQKPFDILMIFAVINSGDNFQFNLSNTEKKYFETVTKALPMLDFKISEKNLLRLLLEFTKRTLIDIFTIQLVLSNNFKNSIDDFLQISKIIVTSKITDFPIDGNDLIELKIAPKNIGKVLKIAKEYWWENDFLVNKKELCFFVKNDTRSKQIQ